MKKIPTLFVRDHDTKLVTPEITPGCEWVAEGCGHGTRKFDGTCCLVRGGKLFKRYEVKPGGKPPANFEPANDVDEVTNKQQGWVPVGDGPDDRWHREAFAEIMGVTGRKDITFEAVPISDGTWELVGPKIQGNPENAPKHLLVAHGACPLLDCPRDFAGIKAYLRIRDIEGIVWHHPDGRLVKIKKKNFGLQRKP